MGLLDGKIALITGGARGIGAAIVRRFVAEGATVAFTYARSTGPAEALVAELGADKAKAYQSDAASFDAAAQLIKDVTADFGNISILVNNAGILRDGLMVKAKDGDVVKRMELASWQAVIDVNLTGVFLCGREAATQMIKTGSRGAIINISSIARAGNMGQSNYSAAKAGVAALATVWAKELARYNIRSMAIAPGFIETDMTASMKQDALEKLCAGIPAKRMGQPHEIAQTVAFIFENDYVSGRVIEVDGAMRL